MRRASTVINDALIAPGTQITPFQSTRLPDLHHTQSEDEIREAPLGMIP